MLCWVPPPLGTPPPPFCFSVSGMWYGRSGARKRKKRGLMSYAFRVKPLQECICRSEEGKFELFLGAFVFCVWNSHMLPSIASHGDGRSDYINSVMYHSKQWQVYVFVLISVSPTPSLVESMGSNLATAGAAFSTFWPAAWRCSSRSRSTTRPPTGTPTSRTLCITTTPLGAFSTR